LIFAREGDQIGSIAAEFNVYSWQLLKYNEMDKKTPLVQGQMIYLQRKKRLSIQEIKKVL
jgi:hypothetical protein